ncbi:MAG: RnfABCDGE type electron transport complex subunit D [Bacillales bacterium]|nr:RnfABCDGE type electron transport complex subunit D [Bacillales bacterium]
MRYSNGVKETIRVQSSNGYTRAERISFKKAGPKSTGGFRKFIKTPKGYLMILLWIFMTVGLVHNNPAKAIVNVALAVGVSIVLDWVACVIEKRKRITVDGGIITGLIISLVLSTAAPWYQVMVATFFAIISKHIFIIHYKPVFNPAAFGLLISFICFSSEQSWWGGMSLLPIWCLSLILIGGYFITKKVNKFPQVLTFLGVYFLLFVLCHLFHLTSAREVFRPPLLNSTLFMAFFMLTDPPTSPAKYKDQIFFSMIAATTSVFLYIMVGGLSYLLIGLLLANGWKTLKTAVGRKAQRVDFDG